MSMDETKLAELQKEWDRILVSSFYNYPYAKITMTVAIFRSQHQDLSLEEFNLLKRVPKNMHHFHVTVQRYVCAFLPKVAATLWKYNIDYLDKLAEAVTKLNSDCREKPVDEFTQQQEVSELRKAKYDSKTATLKRVSLRRRNAIHGRNNQWHVTK
jgi:hypothetical protein